MIQNIFKIQKKTGREARNSEQGDRAPGTKDPIAGKKHEDRNASKQG
jgi:hypothetical protein